MRKSRTKTHKKHVSMRKKYRKTQYRKTQYINKSSKKGGARVVNIEIKMKANIPGVIIDNVRLDTILKTLKTDLNKRFIKTALSNFRAEFYGAEIDQNDPPPSINNIKLNRISYNNVTHTYTITFDVECDNFKQSDIEFLKEELITATRNFEYHDPGAEFAVFF